MYQDEGLVERTLASVMRLVDRVVRATTVLFIVALVICVGSFWLGLQALDDGVESVWTALGIVFGAIAIGSAWLARWRIGRVRKHVPQLTDDIRQLVAGSQSTATTVIDVFEDGSTAPSAIGATRTVIGMRGLVNQSLTGTAKLAEAVHAITSFPWLALVTVAITSVFGFLALIFLLALAL